MPPYLGSCMKRPAPLGRRYYSLSAGRGRGLVISYLAALNRHRAKSGRQLRSYSNLPPPPPPYHYFVHQQQQQQQQQERAAAESRGTWQNPMVVQLHHRGDTALWELMKTLLWFYLLSQLFQITWEWDDKSDGKGKEKSASSDKGSSSSSSSSSSDSFGVGGLLGGLVGKEQVKPVDLSQTAHDIHWSDVHGCDEAKEELKEVVEFLKNPEKFTRLGGKLPKGFLLVGPPGTGKTMLAKAIAKEAGVPFFYASGAQFEEVFVGVGSRRVRDLFTAARAKKPCLVFIDEIDAVGSKRSRFDASHDRATINQLLSEMDGFHSSDSIIVLAATNSPQSLDKALTRPGRFDKLVSVDPPDLKGRTLILEHYLKKVKAAPDLDAKVIARGTNGMVGADLANVVNIATIQAAKLGLENVTQACLEDAKDRVHMGVEQKSRRIPEDERRNTAYHEAGHALVALFTDKAAPLHKATIVPRGQALGVTMQLPPDDQISYSLGQMKARLRVLMGGRIAEETVFGSEAVTSGASNDLEQATQLAKAMVRKYGLSASMGCVDYSFADDPKGVYLSNKTRRKIEEEVKNILDAAYRDATEIIHNKRAILNSIAEGLLVKETLTGTEMRKLAGLPEPEVEK
eukprot:Sspe_Gene.33541::Locus_16367_Transcript_1_1_Confidence_1.000_Length_2028::g.33541::m.33541/K08955/YME1; ATP-dependent metalloprotease